MSRKQKVTVGSYYPTAGRRYRLWAIYVDGVEYRTAGTLQRANDVARDLRARIDAGEHLVMPGEHE